jgi:hypothetical protein
VLWPDGIAGEFYYFSGKNKAEGGNKTNISTIF